MVFDKQIPYSSVTVIKNQVSVLIFSILLLKMMHQAATFASHILLSIWNLNQKFAICNGVQQKILRKKSLIWRGKKKKSEKRK